MSVSPLQSAQATGAYTATAAQQPAYAGSVHFGGHSKRAKDTAETGDTVEFTQQAGAGQTDDNDPVQQNQSAGKAGQVVKQLAKAGAKLAAAGVLGALGATILLPLHWIVLPVAAALGLWGVLDLYKSAKFAKGKGDAGDAETPPADDQPAEDVPGSVPADGAETVVPLDEEADGAEAPDEATVTLEAEPLPELPMSGAKISLFQGVDQFTQKLSEAIESTARANLTNMTDEEVEAVVADLKSTMFGVSKTEQVTTLVEAINALVVPCYSNVEALPADTNGNKKIDKALLDEVFRAFETSGAFTRMVGQAAQK